MMQVIQTSRLGFGLISLMISITVGAIALLGGAQIYRCISNSAVAEAKRIDAAILANEIALYLRLRLGGTRSLQGTTLVTPGTNFRSTGPGIFVLPGEASNATGERGPETLYIVTKKNEKADLTLNESVRNTLGIKIENPDVLPANYFSAGEMFVITNFKTSAVFQSRGNSPTAPLVHLTFDLATLDDMASMRPGDKIFKAEITKIGIEPVKNVLFAQNTRTGEIHYFPQEVADFKLDYKVQSSPGVYLHDWVSMNSNPINYRAITSIRISFSMLYPIYGSGVTQTSGKAPFSLEFPMN